MRLRRLLLGPALRWGDARWLGGRYLSRLQSASLLLLLHLQLALLHLLHDLLRSADDAWPRNGWRRVVRHGCRWRRRFFRLWLLRLLILFEACVVLLCLISGP